VNIDFYAASVIILTPQLIYLSYIDLLHYKIHNKSILILFLSFLILSPFYLNIQEIAYRSIFSFAIFFILLLPFSRGLIGGGDVKLLAVIFLWIGVEKALDFYLYLSFFTIFFIFISIIGIIPKLKNNNKTYIPFGPAVSCAAILNFLLHYSN